MLQDVLSLKPPNEIIDEAARFFTQRRIKVIARSKSSLRFALSTAHEAEAGQVKAVREATGQTRVSVETGGLSVWHIAESYVRDLRKQARSGARSRRHRRAASTTRLTGASLDSLGSVLGMEPPRPQRPAAHRPTPAPTPPARRSRRPPSRLTTSLHRRHWPGIAMRSPEGSDKGRFQCGAADLPPPPP